jgi:hypothetical protein
MSEPTCINLVERFGTDYRITFEEGYAHKGMHRDNLDPWYMQIPARFGTIYPYGGNTLGVMIDNHRYVSKKLAGLACCRLVLNQANLFWSVLLRDAEKRNPSAICGV